MRNVEVLEKMVIKTKNSGGKEIIIPIELLEIMIVSIKQRDELAEIAQLFIKKQKEQEISKLLAE